MSEEIKSEKNKETQEIKEMLEKNISLNKEVLEKVNKINKFIVWQKVFSVLKILIIFIPIILGIIYLPPLFKNIFEQYSQVLNIDLGELNKFIK